MRLKTVLLSVSLAIVLLCSACSMPSTVETPAPAGPEIAWGFGSAEEIVQTLCSQEMAGRTVGSSGGLKATEYIAGAFEAAGLAPFEGESFLIEYADQTAEPSAAKAEVALIAADGMETQLAAGVDYVFTMPYMPFDIQLPVSGKKADCEAGEAVFFTVNYNAALEYAAEGLDRVAVTDKVGKAVMSGNSALGEPRGVLLSILSEAAREGLRTEGVQLRLRMQTAAQEAGTAYNVAGRFPGENRDEALLVLAHYDGSGACGELLFPSAYDNASGVAAMLRALALFSERNISPARDIVFLATGGEENGKDGARAFAALLGERYAKVNIINIDCIGHAGRDFIDVYTEETANINPLAAALAEAGAAQGARVCDETYSGDGAVLRESGTRLAVTLSDAVYEGEKAHTPEDVPELLDYERIEAAAALVEGYLAAAHAEPLFEAERDETAQAAAAATQEERRAELVAEHKLAWNEAYCTVENGGYTMCFYFGDTFETPEKFLRLIPGLAEAETGTYALSAVKLSGGTWLKDGVMELPCNPEQGTLMELYTQQNFPIETFTEGEKYTLAELDTALEGALGESIGAELLYAAGEQVCAISVGTGKDPVKEQLATLDAAALFGAAEFEGIFIMPFNAASDGSAGVTLASYMGETRGKVNLYRINGDGQIAGTTLEDMEALLREIDMKGILDAFLAPEFGG